MKPSDLKLNASDVKCIIATELKLHPNVELTDLYKLIYQAYFGPAHIRQDRALLLKSIAAEFSTITEHHYQPSWQDIGNTLGFQRLSLSLLVPAYRRGTSEFLHKCGLWADLLLLSCFTEKPDYTMQDVWTLHLGLIQNIISAPLTAWEQAANMALCEQIPSHSDTYRTTYHPHYRVVYPYRGDLMSEILDNIDTLKELP